MALFLFVLMSASVGQSKAENTPDYYFELEKGKQAWFPIELKTGNAYHVTFRQETAIIKIELFDPTCKRVKAVMSTNSLDNDIFFQFKAHHSGTYTIIISAKNRGFIGKSKGYTFDDNEEKNLSQDNPMIQSVKKHSNPIQTIELESNDFSDLMPLKKAIGDSRFVFLGEQSHKEAESHLAKARLVAFLHQEMGFDVLAFESELYGTRMLWEKIVAGTVGDHDWRKGLNLNWSPLNEFSPMRSYIESNAKSNRPLYLVGIDNQPGRFFKDTFIEELKRVLRRDGITTPSNDFLMDLQHAMNRDYYYNRLEVLPAEQQQEIIETMDQLIEEVSRASKDQFWIQALKSLASALPLLLEGRHLYPSRDPQMADNFLWYARHVYPNKKIIVYAANSHLVRKPHLLSNAAKDTTYDGITIAGDIIWHHYPTEIYSIFVTSLEGEIAEPYEERNRQSDSWLPHIIHPNQHPELEIEEMLAMTGHEYAFLDIRGLARKETWINQPLIAKPFGYSSNRASWPRVVDGFFFIKTVSPVNYAPWFKEWWEADKAKKKAAKE